ncbi:MAG: hypothetical protein Kow0077_32010 [Anaerolineae bacterium]
MKKIMLLGGVLLLVLGALTPVMAQDDEPPAPRTLVWLAGGRPGQPAGPGTLAWVKAGSEPVEIAPVPDEGPGTRVLVCGQEAVFAAEEQAAVMLFIGAERGGLYRLTLDDAPALTRLADAHALACVGPDRAMFSADGNRWAFIEYPMDVTRRGPYATGRLHVLAMPEGEPAAAVVEDVAAFGLDAGGVYTVQLFPNALGLADEVVLTYWGETGMREMLAMMPADGCDWTSAALDVHEASGQVALSLGEHCPGGSQWRLFTVEGNADPVEHVYMPSGGAFLPASTINQVHYLPEGDQLLAVFPNGRAANIGNLVLVDLTANTVTLVTEGVTVDLFPDGRARHLRYSPGGNYLAYVSSTANNEHFLHRLALDGGFMPDTISAGPRGDAVTTFTWRPDDALVYVAGGVNGLNNALYVLPAGEETPQRVIRGKFVLDVGQASPTAVTLLNHRAPDDDFPDPTADLVQVGFDGLQQVLLDGRESGLVAYPLLVR